MSANTDQMLGQLDGKLDALTASLAEWRSEHNQVHAEIDIELKAHAEDINKAKGAKAAIFVLAAGISSFVSIALAAATHLLK